MSRGPQTFRQRDLVVAIKAVIAAGLDPLRVEIQKDGAIVIVTTTACKAQPADEASPSNEWDDLK